MSGKGEKKVCRNRDQLKVPISKSWEELDEDVVRAAVAKVPGRLKFVSSNDWMSCRRCIIIKVLYISQLCCQIFSGPCCVY